MRARAEKAPVRYNHVKIIMEFLKGSKDIWEHCLVFGIENHSDDSKGGNARKGGRFANKASDDTFFRLLHSIFKRVKLKIYFLVDPGIPSNNILNTSTQYK